MIWCVAQSGNVILIARSLLESTFREPPSVGARRLFFASCNHVWGHARMCERPPIVVCYFSEAVECDFSFQATSGFGLARIIPLTDRHFLFGKPMT